jgi:hypothetical protein
MWFQQRPSLTAFAFSVKMVFHHMVKEAIPLKERDFEPRFEALLLSLFNKVPFLQLESIAKDDVNSYSQKFAIDTPVRPDWTAKVRASGRLWTLLVETKLLGQPRSCLVSLSKYGTQRFNWAVTYRYCLKNFIATELFLPLTSRRNQLASARKPGWAMQTWPGTPEFRSTTCISKRARPTTRSDSGKK